MIEHVGHEYMEEFFRCCDSLLEEDGLFVLQVITQMVSSLFPRFITMSWFYNSLMG